MKIWKILAVLCTFSIQPAFAASWHEWNSNGLGMTPGPGGMKDGPSAVLWGPGNANLSVFVRGPDDALWGIMNQNGKWGGWTSLGGAISSAPSCVAMTNSRVACFARAGADNGLWTINYSAGKWSGWGHLQGIGMLGAPSAVSLGGGIGVAVLARGSDSALWLMSAKVGSLVGEPWHSLHGVIVTDPACAEPSNEDMFLTCFAMGTPQEMFQWQEYSWTPTDGATVSQGSLVEETHNSAFLFVQGNDNVLWRNSMLVQGGGGWESLGGLPNMASGPSCVRQGTITASTWACFARSTFGFLMERRYF